MPPGLETALAEELDGCEALAQERREVVRRVLDLVERVLGRRRTSAPTCGVETT